MSRTVFALVAAGAAVIALALGVAWRGKQVDQAAVATHVARPAAETAPPAMSSDSRPAAVATATPSFDVARIGPDGRAVIAGRAAPGAKIVLLDGGKEIAQGEADARGEWVLIVQDPPLAAGAHELRVVQHIEGKAPVTSEQMVVAVVPKPAESKDETLVMIAPPGGPATLVQPPSATGVPKSGDLQVSTLDYDERGKVTVTGQAAAGTSVRVYVDDKLAAEGIAGPDGRWRLAPSAPIDSGKHRLRVDRLGKDGKPTDRLEIPFERPAETASAVPGGRRLHVVRGDNLWNIARAHYGEGWRYTVIFDANKNQIRDPDLIYPGQIFSLPKAN